MRNAITLHAYLPLVRSGMYSAVAFVRRNIICIAVISAICVQYFYSPSYWVFVILSGISLLEKRTYVKIALVIVTICAYIVINIQIKKIHTTSDNYITDNFYEEHFNDKQISSEWNSLNDVFVLKLDSEREKKFLRLAHKLYDEYNAIIFSCKIDKKVFNLLLTQLFDFNYYRAITNSSLNTKIEKNNVLLTYICVSAKRWVFRISHKKDYAVVLSKMGPDIGFQIFDNLLRVGSICKPGEVYLNFIKFYPKCTWNKLKKLMKNYNGYKQSCYTFNYNELDHHQYEYLCELLCISPKDYKEFLFLFVTRDELRNMISVNNI
eukprot:jgi/Antlo1/1507/2054